MVSESGARVGVVVAGGGVVTAPTVVVVVGAGSGMVVVATEMVVVVPAVEAVQAVTTKISRTGRALTWKNLASIRGYLRRPPRTASRCCRPSAVRTPP
jgi:flagellar motor component MotA